MKFSLKASVRAAAILFVGACGLMFTANAAEPNSCAPEQVELFSCPLKSKTTIALCLNKEKLTTELVRVDPQGTRIATSISDLKQFYSMPNNHGYETILEGKASKGKISLFIETNPSDLLNPALSIDNGNDSHTDFCSGYKYRNSDSQYRLPQNKLKLKNKAELISIRDLLRLGVSMPLAEDDVPTWPDEEKAHQ